MGSNQVRSRSDLRIFITGAFWVTGKNNKTDARINDLVAKNFRIKMAINTIKNAREVQDAA